MKGPRRLSAALVGLVFYIAGFLKLIDPAGATFVVDSYLSFFHLGFLSAVSAVIAEVLALAEAFTGLALLCGVYRKLAAKVAFSLTALFTAITLLLVIFNPDMDCGCFGKAIKLTHLQSFIKNLILLFLLFVAFIPLREQPEPRRTRNVFKTLSAFVVALSLYSMFFLPLRDFTPFSSGSRLYDAAKASAFVPAEPLFVYEKGGFKKEFDLDHLPDTTWTFVGTHERGPVSPSGIEALVSVSNAAGEVCDSVLLEGRVMAFCVHSPESLSESAWHGIAEAVSASSEAGFTPALLLASSAADAERIFGALPAEDRLRLMLPLYFGDRKTLLTLVRSNGGAVYIADGLVVDKWSRLGMPSALRFEELHSMQPVAAMMEKSINGRIVMDATILLTVLLAMFL